MIENGERVWNGNLGRTELGGDAMAGKLATRCVKGWNKPKRMKQGEREPAREMWRKKCGRGVAGGPQKSEVNPPP